MEGQEIHDTSLEQGGAFQNWNELRTSFKFQFSRSIWIEFELGVVKC